MRGLGGALHWLIQKVIDFVMGLWHKVAGTKGPSQESKALDSKVSPVYEMCQSLLRELSDPWAVAHVRTFSEVGIGNVFWFLASDEDVADYQKQEEGKQTIFIKEAVKKLLNQMKPDYFVVWVRRMSQEQGITEPRRLASGYRFLTKSSDCSMNPATEDDRAALLKALVSQDSSLKDSLSKEDERVLFPTT
jgi:hypothetical protein